MFSGVPTAVFQTASRETDAPPLAFAGFKKNAAAKSAQRTEREDKKRKAMKAVKSKQPNKIQLDDSNASSPSKDNSDIQCLLSAGYGAKR